MPPGSALSHSKSNSMATLRRFLHRRTALLGALVLMIMVLAVVIGPFFLENTEGQIDLSVSRAPASLDHPLGTDFLGRDTLSRIIYGGRISLILTTGAVATALIVGTTIGLTAGYLGNVVDMILMRFVDMLLIIPGFLLAIAVVAALGPGTYNVMIAVGVAAIPGFARIARGSSLLVSGQEYITAANTIGASNVRVLLRHILPNAAQPLIVQSTLRLATAMLSISSLSFLGLGPQPPTPEWGAMMADSRDYFTTSPELILYPGIAIFIVALSFNLIGDGLRDALDPHLSQS